MERNPLGHWGCRPLTAERNSLGCQEHSLWPVWELLWDGLAVIEGENNNMIFQLSNITVTSGNGATEARQYVYHPILSIVSEFEYPKIPYLCCLTFLRQQTRIVFGKWESILYCLRWLIPPKIYLIHKISGRIEEKMKKTKTIFFSFVNPNTRQWIFSPTKKILIPVSGPK
jgi:hypothetical protein